jgi:heat induced stress protein YflT
MTTPADNPSTAAGGSAVPPPDPTAPPAGPAASAVPPTGPAASSVPPAGPAASSVPPGPAGVPALPSQTGGLGAAPTATVVVGSYADYALAQQAVDYLSDNKFPVERTAIIGTDLRLVENVLGRLTTARAAGAGLASGAWFGLLIGLLLGIFSNSNWFAVIFVCLLIGAAWGAVFGAIAHSATGGRRDFASRSSLQAGQYAVTTDPEVADQARSLLVQLNWRASGAQ